jgi:hypothetical protein
MRVIELHSLAGSRLSCIAAPGMCSAIASFSGRRYACPFLLALEKLWIPRPPPATRRIRKISPA